MTRRLAIKEEKICSLQRINDTLRSREGQFRTVIAGLQGKLKEYESASNRANATNDAVGGSGEQRQSGSSDGSSGVQQTERERSLVAEVDKLRRQVSRAEKLSDQNYKTANSLKQTLIEKRREIKQLEDKVATLENENVNLRIEVQDLDNQLRLENGDALERDSDSEFTPSIAATPRNTSTRRLRSRTLELRRDAQSTSSPRRSRRSSSSPNGKQRSPRQQSPSRRRTRSAAAIDLQSGDETVEEDQSETVPSLPDADYRTILVELKKVYTRPVQVNGKTFSDGPPPYKTTDWAARAPMSRLIRFCVQTQCGIPDRGKPNTSKDWNWLKATKSDISEWIMQTPYGQKKYSAEAKKVSNASLSEDEKRKAIAQFVTCWKPGFALKAEDAAKMPTPPDGNNENQTVEHGSIGPQRVERHALNRRDSQVDFEQKDDQKAPQSTQEQAAAAQPALANEPGVAAVDLVIDAQQPADGAEDDQQGGSGDDSGGNGGLNQQRADGGAVGGGGGSGGDSENEGNRAGGGDRVGGDAIGADRTAVDT